MVEVEMFFWGTFSTLITRQKQSFDGNLHLYKQILAGFDLGISLDGNYEFFLVILEGSDGWGCGILDKLRLNEFEAKKTKKLLKKPRNRQKKSCLGLLQRFFF